MIHIYVKIRFFSFQVLSIVLCVKLHDRLFPEMRLYMRCTQFGKSLIVLWKHVITLWKHLFSWYICLHIKQFLFIFLLICILLHVKYPGNIFFVGGGFLILNVLYKLIVCDTYYSIFITNKEPQYLRILKSLKWAVAAISYPAAPVVVVYLGFCRCQFNRNFTKNKWWTGPHLSHVSFCLYNFQDFKQSEYVHHNTYLIDTGK